MRALFLSAPLVAMLLACSAPPPSTQSTPAQSPGAAIPELEAILEEFRTDARATERKYKGQVVTVSGVVDSAEWSDKKSKGPHAILWVGDRKTIIATFYGRKQADDVVALKKGDRAQVRGKILNGTYNAAEGVLYVTVDECELVSPLREK